jgi:hypothetical protein
MGCVAVGKYNAKSITRRKDWGYMSRLYGIRSFVRSANAASYAEIARAGALAPGALCG